MVARLVSGAAVAALAAALVPLSLSPSAFAEPSSLGLGPSCAGVPSPRLSPTATSALLARDRTAHVDRCGQVFYADPAPAATTATDTVARPAPAVLAVGTDAFALHSRPSATRTIYLDFDGATLTGTVWNATYSLPAGYVMSPYDSDGHPSTFSATERALIGQVWLAVAEDFAPFDVDVTTQDPGPEGLGRADLSDTTYGVTALITNDTGPVRQACGCGGYAYIGVAGFTGSGRSYYQPALVFAAVMWNRAKNIAEATSHELGHNFGLYHDGYPANAYYPGQGAWAPIMGVGYSRPVTQWSKGEYAGANQKQDDLAVIALNAPIMADDVGSTPETAAPITSGVVLDRLITPGDEDWYSFTTSGSSVTVDVAPQPFLPDLDARAEVYASDGTTLVATIDPVAPATPTSNETESGLGATRVLGGLPAGTYLVRVTGTGVGDPLTTGYTSYGSLGRYTISVKVDPPLTFRTSTLAPGTVGRAYSQRLPIAGGSGVYLVTSRVGTLPLGLSLSGSGLLSGRPAAPANAVVTVTVRDSHGTTTTRRLTMAVRLNVVLTTRPVLPAARLGHAYATSLRATAGSGPYRFRLVSGYPSRGIALSSTGRLTGTPTRRGTFRFVVLVRDAVGRTSSRAFTLTVR